MIVSEKDNKKIFDDNALAIEIIELSLLLEAMYQRYGYDFRDYAMTSMKRRVQLAMSKEAVSTISAYQERILHDEKAIVRFLDDVSVTVTAIFRDPDFYKALRDKVLPTLQEFPLIRVWHVGCATGEEVYSTAIMLHEEGLLNHSKCYATDMNQRSLDIGKQGIYPIKKMKAYTGNYQNAGGKDAFSNYYVAKYEHVILKEFLRNNIIWAQHNLVSDSSFNEFHLILCRNVMIYFNRTLQNRVHHLIYNSLTIGGVLGLGRGETLQFTPYEECYEVIDRFEKIYRKIR
jgi:chemotaxis protein methyltransferase CheR